MDHLRGDLGQRLQHEAAFGYTGVRDFKARGQQVIYWVSEEFPDWYTEDRQPDLAVVSEGQEHEAVVDAKRVVFTGGDFMLCLLRNVQMTLHGILQARTRTQVHFMFPADAIWATDIWNPAGRQAYPAPMVLLNTAIAACASNQAVYDEIVAPFLNQLFTHYPVANYPLDAPAPPLDALVDGWNVDVAIDDSFSRRYRDAGSPNTICFEFQTVSRTTP